MRKIYANFVPGVLSDEQQERLLGDNREMAIKTVRNPPYSSYLAACGFWLFLKLKKNRFKDIEKMKKDVPKVLGTFTLDDFHGVYTEGLGRYNKCIGVRGS